MQDPTKVHRFVPTYLRRRQMRLYRSSVQSWESIIIRWAVTRYIAFDLMAIELEAFRQGPVCNAAFQSGDRSIPVSPRPRSSNSVKQGWTVLATGTTRIAYSEAGYSENLV